MNSDPGAYILAAALVSGAIGFFGCALIVSGRIREECRRAYEEGYGAANREANKPKL